jgi:hypothetical protein
MRREARRPAAGAVGAGVVVGGQVIVDRLGEAEGGAAQRLDRLVECLVGGPGGWIVQGGELVSGLVEAGHPRRMRGQPL